MIIPNYLWFIDFLFGYFCVFSINIDSIFFFYSFLNLSWYERKSLFPTKKSCLFLTFLVRNVTNNSMAWYIFNKQWWGWWQTIFSIENLLLCQQEKIRISNRKRKQFPFSIQKRFNQKMIHLFQKLLKSHLFVGFYFDNVISLSIDALNRKQTKPNNFNKKAAIFFT